jgi:hydrogenase maturation protease
MPAAPHILVAGIGNIFLGDDAFGSEVAQKLLRRPHPPHVRVVDFGIRGLDLVYALADGCDAAILIDAVPRPNEPPGTLYVLEPDLQTISQAAPPLIEAHSMDPMRVLATAAAMGARPRRILIVGCQPAWQPTEDDDGSDTPMTLSEPVAAALDPAVEMVELLIERLSSELAVQTHNPNPQEVSPCIP